MLVSIVLVLVIYIVLVNAENKGDKDNRLYDDDTLNDTTWFCIDIQSTIISPGVIWKTENCTKGDPLVEPPLLTVNSVTADLDVVNIVPAAAIDNFESGLATVPQMSKLNSQFIAGINGGYFWRVDVQGVWIDDVCWGKTRADAEKPVSSSNFNYGIGDGLVKIDGIVKSNNCNCPGNDRPAVLAINGDDTHIEVLYRGQTVNESIPSAIAAGPNLVSYNFDTGVSYVDIPSDDDNVNLLGHTANSAIGLYLNPATKKTSKIILVTTDGSNDCTVNDSSCGIISRYFASLMLNKFEVQMSMEMDQGGSSCLWVNGTNPSRDGVVNRSHNTSPEDTESPRNIANALFLQLK